MKKVPNILLKNNELCNVLIRAYFSVPGVPDPIMRWEIILYGVLVLAVPGNPNDYTLLVDTGATAVSVLACHLFRAYLTTRPTNQRNIISYSLVIMSWICELIVCKEYALSVAMNVIPDQVKMMLSEYQMPKYLFTGSQPIFTLVFANVLCLVTSRLLLVLDPGKRIFFTKAYIYIEL